MHDTTPQRTHEDLIFEHWMTSFDPKHDASQPVSNQSFYAGTDADFIKEYRLQLSALKMRVESDYDDLRSRVQKQARRIDSLEGLLPVVRMQQTQLNDVVCDVRAIKRTLIDLQCDLAAQKRTILGRASAWIERVAQALKSQ